MLVNFGCPASLPNNGKRRSQHQKHSQLPIVILGADMAYRWAIKARRSVACTVHNISNGSRGGRTLLMHVPTSGYQYKVGDRIYLRAPEVAALQWHAFSIASVHGDDGYFTVAITMVSGSGNSTWTSSLEMLATAKKGSEVIISSVYRLTMYQCV
jgi:hypothetical protein